MPVPALLLLLAAADWVPARWFSSEPQSLELLQKSPINCLLLEKEQWTPGLTKAAHDRHLVALGIVRPGANPLEEARRAVPAQLDGVVLEGAFDAAVTQKIRSVLQDSKILTVELPPRSRMRFDAEQPAIGTYQGVWPGIEAQVGGAAKSAPSGAPWIDTNTGFLRFSRAAASNVPVWIANTPPPRTIVTPARYAQAIADAAITGARWVVAVDDSLRDGLLKNDSTALKTWQAINEHLNFYESHRDWRGLEPYGSLAVVEDVKSGALLSGGVLDMIAVKNTPVRPVPNRRLSQTTLGDSKMAVDVDPSTLTPEQKAVLVSFTRRGGTLLNGPEGWKFPTPEDGQITMSDAATKKLDEIWKEVNAMTGRKNLGVRLFNVSSMLSNLLTTPERKIAVLHLVNYADFPVENVTVHMMAKFAKAKLYTPDGQVRNLEVYEGEDGSGVDIDRIATVGTLVLE